LRGGRSVDELLWKGAQDAPMVQRIGAGIFALAFFLLAIFFIGMATNGGSWIEVIFAAGLLAIGARIMWSATRH
jgi:hypothetical protein